MDEVQPPVRSCNRRAVCITESVEDPTNQAKEFLHVIGYAQITSIAGRIVEGKLQKKEEIYDRVLIRKETFLRPGHISTLGTVNNLSFL